MPKTTTVGTLQQLFKAIKVELSDKRSDLGLSKVRGRNFFDKRLATVDLESASIWCEGYDTVVTVPFRIRQEAV
jgi:hypothetical protein